MTLRHEFRCPLDQAVIERPDQLRVLHAERQGAAKKKEMTEKCLDQRIVKRYRGYRGE